MTRNRKWAEFTPEPIMHSAVNSIACRYALTQHGLACPGSELGHSPVAKACSVAPLSANHAPLTTPLPLLRLHVAEVAKTGWDCPS